MTDKQIPIQMALIFFPTKPLTHQSEHGLHRRGKKKVDCHRREEAIWQLLNKHRLKPTSSSAYKKQDK